MGKNRGARGVGPIDCLKRRLKGKRREWLRKFVLRASCVPGKIGEGELLNARERRKLRIFKAKGIVLEKPARAVLH